MSSSSSGGKTRSKRTRGIVSLTCPVCGKSFVGDASLSGVRSNYRRHLLVHSGERPYLCVHCGDGFTTRHNMRRHVRSNHPEFATPERPAAPKRRSAKAHCSVAKIPKLPASCAEIESCASGNLPADEDDSRCASTAGLESSTSLLSPAHPLSSTVSSVSSSCMTTGLAVGAIAIATCSLSSSSSSAAVAAVAHGVDGASRRVSAERCDVVVYPSDHGVNQRLNGCASLPKQPHGAPNNDGDVDVDNNNDDRVEHDACDEPEAQRTCDTVSVCESATRGVVGRGARWLCRFCRRGFMWEATRALHERRCRHLVRRAAHPPEESVRVTCTMDEYTAGDAMGMCGATATHTRRAGVTVEPVDPLLQTAHETRASHTHADACCSSMNVHNARPSDTAHDGKAKPYLDSVEEKVHAPPSMGQTAANTCTLRPKTFICENCEVEVSNGAKLRRHMRYYCPFRDDVFADPLHDAALRDETGMQHERFGGHILSIGHVNRAVNDASHTPESYRTHADRVQHSLASAADEEDHAEDDNEACYLVRSSSRARASSMRTRHRAVAIGMRSPRQSGGDDESAVATRRAALATSASKRDSLWSSSSSSSDDESEDVSCDTDESEADVRPRSAEDGARSDSVAQHGRSDDAMHVTTPLQCTHASGAVQQAEAEMDHKDTDSEVWDEERYNLDFTRRHSSHRRQRRILRKRLRALEKKRREQIRDDDAQAGCDYRTALQASTTDAEFSVGTHHAKEESELNRKRVKRESCVGADDHPAAVVAVANSLMLDNSPPCAPAILYPCSEWLQASAEVWLQLSRRKRQDQRRRSVRRHTALTARVHTTYRAAEGDGVPRAPAVTDESDGCAIASWDTRRQQHVCPFGSCMQSFRTRRLWLTHVARRHPGELKHMTTMSPPL